MEDKIENHIFKKAKNLVFRELEGNFIIIPSNTDTTDEKTKYYTINETAKEVWERLDGIKTVKEIKEELLLTYNTNAEQLSEDIKVLLDDMLNKKLIVYVRS